MSKLWILYRTLMECCLDSEGGTATLAHDLRLERVAFLHLALEEFSLVRALPQGDVLELRKFY